jgi:hypothetical protein
MATQRRPTDQEFLTAICAVNRDWAVARLGGLRRSDLDRIAHANGVRTDVSRNETGAELAGRLFDAVKARAQQRARQTRQRAARKPAARASRA